VPGLEARIDGATALKQFADHLKREGDKGLAKQMSRALGKAVEPVKASIEAEAEKTMPSSGGYASLLTKSLRHRMSRRTGTREAQIRLTTYADGTEEKRDLPRLEKGELRHPVWGRSRKLKRGHRAGTIIRNPWAVTSIRPGFHRRGTDEAIDKAQDALLGVIQDYARRLADG
jgi:hypothetical protein